MEIQPDLTLAIAYSGEAKYLSGLLGSIATTADPVSCETIVVHRPAAPPPAELFRAFPRVLFLEEDGATEAALVNQALRLGQGRYLSLWSESLIVKPQALYRLLVLLDDRPELGVVAPRITGNDGMGRANAGPLPGLFHAPPGRPKATPPVAADETPIPAAWLSGQALCFRREVTDDIGLLDGGFRSCYADADFCRRASRAGWRLALLPSAEAIDTASAEETIPSCAKGDLARFLLRAWLPL